MKKPCQALAGMVAVGALAHPALALENGTANFPAGTTGTNLGFPPLPGIFVLDQTNAQSFNGAYDNRGAKEALEDKGHAVANTVRILLSYPVLLPGNGHLYSQITLPGVSLHMTVAGEKMSATGLANPAFSPLIANWKLTRTFQIIAGLDIVTPGGSVSTAKLGASTGYMSWCPNIGFRYTMPRGIDFGALDRVLVNAEDHHDDYQSGNVNELDFEGGYQLGGFELGFAGTWLQQFSNDREADGVVPAGGDRAMYVAIGPSVSVTAHVLHRPVLINLNYQIGVAARNTTEPSSLWLNIAFPVHIG